MPRQTTMGRLLVDESLPQPLRGQYGTLDKAELARLLNVAATQHPEEYRDLSHKLNQVGQRVAYRTGGLSFGLKHLRQAVSANARLQALANRVDAILDQDGDDDEKERRIVELARKEVEPLQKEIYEESVKEENPLAYQVLSGSRGNKRNLAALRGSDLLYSDAQGRTIPMPVLNSYSDGLSPAEYWAATYGARQGVLAVKLATADAGYFNKQLTQAAHRLVVTGVDEDDTESTPRGLPVDVSDPDNIGSLLALPAGGYPRNTPLTAKLIKELERKGVTRLLVRSPITSSPKHGGILARDAGIRETGGLAGRGESVGIRSVQALGEPLAQGQLSQKHSGGAAGTTNAVSGFAWVNQLVQAPKAFPGGAAHATAGGRVGRIEELPAGGHKVWVSGVEHFVPGGRKVTVQPGDDVEAGDVLSEGMPNPAKILEYKGLGEGRRYFVKAYYDAYKQSGFPVNRRNVEMLSRALLDHVQLKQEMGDYNPDEVVPYNLFERSYKPRPGYRPTTPMNAVGKYLERPYLHHTIGTQVRPSMLKEFDEFGIKEIDVHDEEPVFKPVMVRGAATLQHDPDFLTRQLGSGQKKTIFDAAHRGAVSDREGTSYVPSLVHGSEFGKEGPMSLLKSSGTSEPNYSGTAGARSGQSLSPAPSRGSSPPILSGFKPAAPPKPPAAPAPAPKPAVPPKPPIPPVAQFASQSPQAFKSFLNAAGEGPGQVMQMGTLLNPGAVGSLMKGRRQPLPPGPLQTPSAAMTAAKKQIAATRAGVPTKPINYLVRQSYQHATAGKTPDQIRQMLAEGNVAPEPKQPATFMGMGVKDIPMAVASLRVPWLPALALSVTPKTTHDNPGTGLGENPLHWDNSQIPEALRKSYELPYQAPPKPAGVLDGWQQMRSEMASPIKLYNQAVAMGKTPNAALTNQVLQELSQQYPDEVQAAVDSLYGSLTGR